MNLNKENLQIKELMEQNKALMEMLMNQKGNVAISKPAERPFKIRRKRKYSLGWFIFWILVFWPIALVQILSADVVEEKVYLD